MIDDGGWCGRPYRNGLPDSDFASPCFVTAGRLPPSDMIIVQNAVTGTSWARSWNFETQASIKLHALQSIPPEQAHD